MTLYGLTLPHIKLIPDPHNEGSTDFKYKLKRVFVFDWYFERGGESVIV